MKQHGFSLSSDSGEVFNVDPTGPITFDIERDDLFAATATVLPGQVIIQSTDIRLRSPRSFTFAADNTPLTLSFCLEGRANISIGVCGKPPVNVIHSPALCAISHLPRAEGVWRPATGRFRSVSLAMPAPHDLALWREFGCLLPPELEPMARGLAPHDFFHSLPVTPQMQAAVSTLAACPVEGRAKQLYLECKSRELLILMIAHMGRMRALSAQAIPLSDADTQSIHEAWRILVANLVNPPSLVQLARMAGINEFKLKKGFRQIFGTTPFNHLRETRLETARAHLESGKYNVCEACMAVGYSNLGNFIGLYRKRFGMTPGDVVRCAQRTRHGAH